MAARAARTSSAGLQPALRPVEDRQGNLDERAAQGGRLGSDTPDAQQVARAALHGHMGAVGDQALQHQRPGIVGDAAHHVQPAWRAGHHDRPLAVEKWPCLVGQHHRGGPPIVSGEQASAAGRRGGPDHSMPWYCSSYRRW